MIDKLRIICEDVAIESESFRSNGIVLELKNVDTCFISQLDINDVLKDFDVKEIQEWLDDNTK